VRNAHNTVSRDSIVDRQFVTVWVREWVTNIRQLAVSRPRNLVKLLSVSSKVNDAEVFRYYRRKRHVRYRIIKAKFHYASWFEAGRRQVRSQVPLRYLVRTSFEPAPNQLA